MNPTAAVQIHAAPVAVRGVFPRERDWWLLAAALGVLYVFCLGSRGLNEPDEGRYANIAQAMAKPGGDWWEPRESGFGHYDKPPLVYWAVAAAFRAFGFNEWAARLPSCIGAALTLAGLAWAAVRLYGAPVAWWATLVAGTSVQLWVGGRLVTPDALMTGWCTLGIAAWAECRHRGGRWGFWCVSLVCWVLAWWTKATPALVPLAGVLAGTYVTGDRMGRLALRPWLLLPAIIILGSPWYLSMLGRYPELMRFFFGRELVERVTGRVDGRHGPIWYYGKVSFFAWLPWWPVAAWKATWRQARWHRQIGPEGWIVLTGLAVFSLTSSKLPTYTLPLAPWAALLMARVIIAGADPRPDWRLSPAALFAVCMMAGAAVPPSRIEARLGPNSSLRPVCQYLRAHGAREIDSDHYWPGMEFYLDGPELHYVLVRAGGTTQRERASDPGRTPGLIVDGLDWLNTPGRPGGSAPASGERWLVRFRRQQDSPFDLALSPDRREKVVTIGDFELFHVVFADGHITAVLP